ncbi:MAG: FN3 associated domain-containing protein, partial [Planctomycetota bacterium]
MRFSIRDFVPGFALVLFLSFSAWAAYYPIGDLDEGRDVDFDDLRLLAQSWLNPSCDEPGCEADLNAAGGVNAVDYALLVKNWGGTAIITEFMASNHSNEPLEPGELLDEDGDSSDWIELFNPSDTAVDLEGWYLTHDRLDLEEWEFPAVTLGPGEFMTVFASKKDRRNPDPNQPLHTNFNLDESGDYLALVRPDGQTIVHEYSPEYPNQRADISYGLGQYAQVLVQSGASGTYHVPTSDLDETEWFKTDFEDAEWDIGPTGLGFGNVTNGFVVTCYRANIELNHIDTAEEVISNPSYQASATTETADVINYHNTGSSGRIGGDAPFPGTTIGVNENNFAVLATGTVHIPFSGNWSFIVHSDDGFNLELTRGPHRFTSSFPNGRAAADTVAVFDLPEAGAYELRLSFYEGGGGSSLELFAGQGSHSSFHPAYHRLVGDTAGGGLAVTNFTSEANTDVQGIMQGVNSTLWSRIEFSAEEVEFFSSMTLRVRYEDGFFAYLNGEEIARANLTGPAAWDSKADVDRPYEESAEFVSFDVSDHIGALREGHNVLAIQGLNDDKDDGQFLLLPELTVSGEVTVSQYFTTATPGEYNTSGALDLVADTTFSKDRGFYDAPFSVIIRTETEGATIHYTTDSSTPSETHGTEYTEPINISTTTCLRAMAFKFGCMPSDVDTHTYIFLDDVVRQPANPPGYPTSWNGYAADYEMDPEIVDDPRYSDRMRDSLLSLPTISIVTDTQNLFHPGSGIYSNPEQEGIAWERPASAEMINPDGTTAFQVNCGLRIYGGWFRKMSGTRKKTFRFLFKRDYGPTKLRYPIFGDKATDEFDTIILRGGANDDIQYLVDEFVRRTLLDLGQPSAVGTFTHLYLNGLYWGLYNPVERPEQSFAATYFGGDKEEWEALNSSRGVGGSTTTMWNAMLSVVRGGMQSNEAFQRIQGNNVDGTNNPAYEDLLDIENYIDYMYSNFWSNMTDWPSHNWYGACRLPPNSTGMKFFNWDSERGLTITTNINHDSTGVSAGAGEPYAALRQNSEFCSLFADHIHRHLFNDGATTTQPSYDRYKELADLIELAMISESARWGDQKSSTPRRLEDWQAGRDYILDTYMRDRPGIALGQLRNAGLYPYLDAPAFYVNGGNQHGGVISPADQVSMTIPDNIAYIFTELVSEGAAVTWHVPTDNSLGTAWTSRTYSPGAGWTYNSPGTGVGYENGSGYEAWIKTDVGAQMSGLETSVFIRINFNWDGSEDFDKLELQMIYDDAFIAYLNGEEVYRTTNITSDVPGSASANWLEASGTFDKFDITAFKDRLVVGQNVLAIHGINASTGSSDMLILPKLLRGVIDDNPSQDIIWYTTNGSDPRQLYGSRNPHALQYAAPFALTKSSNVKARTFDNGQWSALNEATFGVGPVAENLRITEIMFHPRETGDPNDPNEEYIELKNIGGEAINLN